MQAPIKPPIDSLPQEDINATQYKEALDLAYPLAIESYKESERRLDVIEKRLQDLLAFAVSVTLGVTALLAGKINFHNGWFVAAIACWLVGFVIGVLTRLGGQIALISPQFLYDRYLGYSDAHFKLAFVGWAGKAHKINADMIRRKASLTAISFILFLAEALLLTICVASQPPSAIHNSAALPSQPAEVQQVSPVPLGKPAQPARKARRH